MKPLRWIASAKDDLSAMPTFGEVVYVLHVFQKKSKRGIPTPTAERADIGR